MREPTGMAGELLFEVEVNSRDFDAAGAAQQRKLRAYAARLRVEGYLGERIPRTRFPPRFRGLENLFRLELPDGWRALYTVVSRRDQTRIVRILWIGDHQRYDRLFGYHRG